MKNEGADEILEELKKSTNRSKVLEEQLSLTVSNRNRSLNM